MATTKFDKPVGTEISTLTEQMATFPTFIKVVMDGHETKSFTIAGGTKAVFVTIGKFIGLQEFLIVSTQLNGGITCSQIDAGDTRYLTVDYSTPNVLTIANSANNNVEIEIIVFTGSVT